MGGINSTDTLMFRPVRGKRRTAGGAEVFDVHAQSKVYIIFFCDLLGV